MKVNFFSAVALLLGVAALSTPAMADCTYPKAPGSAPNGSTATEGEMSASQQAFGQYQKDMNAYLACLDKEADNSVAALGDKPENAKQIKQIKSMATKRYNSAVNELEARAKELNTQVRAYNAKHAS